MRNRIISPFINGGRDSNTFNSIVDMQTKIPSILGLEIGHIVSLYRFQTEPNFHQRILSMTNDGSGAPVTINSSTNLSVPNVINCFANLCIGTTYYDSATKSTVMWDGTKAIQTTNMATRDEVFNSCGFKTNMTRANIDMVEEQDTETVENNKGGNKI